jgi:mannose-6-phosphate isomerase
MAARRDSMALAGEMGLLRLSPQSHSKPWGKRQLGAWGLGAILAPHDAPIGEIHHRLNDKMGDAPLLVKTLFTAERLSIQVHPNDVMAKSVGAARGKDEAWVVLAAEPGATIGLGLRERCSLDDLRAASLDGSIVDLLDWRDCAAGDVFFAPAGTIHAIGGGVTLFEIQQNLDVTYRLFDYGRGRPLHLENALAAARPQPWCPQAVLASPGKGRELLVEGPTFILERVHVATAGRLRATPEKPVLVAVADGRGEMAGAAFATGEVWQASQSLAISGSADLLLAYEGAVAANDLWLEG